MKTQNRRPLGAFERIFWLLDLQRSVHFTMAAELAGTVPTDEWEKGLLAIQKIHPLLNAGISLNENSAPEFIIHPDAPAIPLRIVKGTYTNGWEMEVERELATPFASDATPLIRAVLYEYANRSVIIMSVHHSIADGRSLSFLIRDLLNAMNGKLAQPQPLPPALDAFTDIPEDVLPGFAIQDTDLPLLNKGQQAGRATPQVRCLQLSPELSNQIIQRAKQEGTTVHGVLSAAFALACKSWKSQPVRIFSPASARETLAVGDNACLCIGGRIVPIDIDQYPNFWDLARHAKESLAGIHSAEDIQGFTKMLFGLVTGGMDSKAMADFADTAMANEYMITNVGVLNYGSDFGKLKLETFWGPFTLTGFDGSQTVGVATINGSIHLTLTTLGHIQVKPVLEFVEQILSTECAALANQATTSSTF